MPLPLFSMVRPQTTVEAQNLSLTKQQILSFVGCGSAEGLKPMERFDVFIKAEVANNGNAVKGGHTECTWVG